MNAILPEAMAPACVDLGEGGRLWDCSTGHDLECLALEVPQCIAPHYEVSAEVLLDPNLASCFFLLYQMYRQENRLEKLCPIDIAQSRTVLYCLT